MNIFQSPASALLPLALVVISLWLLLVLRRDKRRFKSSTTVLLVGAPNTGRTVYISTISRLLEKSEKAQRFTPTQATRKLAEIVITNMQARQLWPADTPEFFYLYEFFPAQPRRWDTESLVIVDTGARLWEELGEEILENDLTPDKLAANSDVLSSANAVVTVISLPDLYGLYDIQGKPTRVQDIIDRADILYDWISQQQPGKPVRRCIVVDLADQERPTSGALAKQEVSTPPLFNDQIQSILESFRSGRSSGGIPQLQQPPAPSLTSNQLEDDCDDCADAKAASRLSDLLRWLEHITEFDFTTNTDSPPLAVNLHCLSEACKGQGYHRSIFLLSSLRALIDAGVLTEQQGEGLARGKVNPMEGAVAQAKAPILWCLAAGRELVQPSSSGQGDT